MSSPSSTNNAPTLLQAIPPALSFLVPLFAAVLLLLALSHRPTHPQGVYPDQTNSRRQRIQAVVAYIAIGIFALLSTLVGALGLRTALGSDIGGDERVGMRGKGELVVQALVFLELDVSVLYLANKYVNWRFKAYLALGLVIPLLCATLVSIAFPIVPHHISPSIPPALSLIFTFLTLPVLVQSLRVYTAKQEPNKAQQLQTAQFEPETAERVQRIPLSLSVPPPSPASSLSSLPSPRSRHEKIPSVDSSTSDLTVVNLYRSPPLSVSFTPHDGRSNAGDLESGGSNSNHDTVTSSLGARIVRSRSRSLLVFLIVAQSAALLSLVMELAAASVMVAATRQSTTALSENAGVHAASVYALLMIIRTALMVLCITGIMSAFLLHAYNAYLRAASTPQQNTTDAAVFPPTLDISRRDAITVSLSADTNASPLSPNKKRPSFGSIIPTTFDRASRKFSLKGRFSNAVVNAVNSQVVFSEVSHDDENEPNAKNYGKKNSFVFNSPVYSRHGTAASVSSSFTSPRLKRTPLKSTLMSPDSDVTEMGGGFVMDTAVRDSKFDDDETESGYAYVYETRDLESKGDGSTDPLDVGLPVPFRSSQGASSSIGEFGHGSKTYSPPTNFASLHHSHTESSCTNEAVENSGSPTSTTSPLGTPTAPFLVPLPKPFANPYPTPRSTPTSSAFAALSESAWLAEACSPGRPTLFFDASRPTTARSGSTGSSTLFSEASRPTTTSTRKGSIGASSVLDKEIQHHRGTFSGDTVVDSRASSPTPTPTRVSTPTPTPTRAPTPTMQFSPFVGGNVIRKRDSTNSKSTPYSPAAPSAFMANLKGKAKTSMLTKHESISNFAQGLEGIKMGLGSSGKAKYSLRASSSHSSLGLGISSGFKFPQLSRRASEIEKRGMRSGVVGSGSDTCGSADGHVDDGDFMDLRDPFASPSVGEGGLLRMASPVDLNMRRGGGRESRGGEKVNSEYEREGVTWYGRSKSAWGKLPLTSAGSGGASSLKENATSSKGTEGKQKQRIGNGQRDRDRDRHKQGKTRTKERTRKGDANGGSSKKEGGEDADFDLEEALLAQRLLMRLDGDLGPVHNAGIMF